VLDSDAAAHDGCRLLVTFDSRLDAEHVSACTTSIVLIHSF